MSSLNIKTIFPFLTWLSDYSVKTFRMDILAGISVGLVLIPQSMANAQLAGLPAHYGLYAALLPTIVGGLFSSSKQMCNGLVAVLAMMTAAALEPLAMIGTPGYIGYVVMLSLMVGLIQFALGVFRLGFLVNFLSQPVISGFTNAAVLLIALAQVNKIFGVTVESSEQQLQTLYMVALAAIEHPHWPSVIMAGLASVIIYGLPRITRKIPAVLSAVIITTIISWALNYEDKTSIPVSSIVSSESSSILNDLARKQDALSAATTARAETVAALQTTSHVEADVHLDLKFRLEQQNLQLSKIRMEMAMYRTKLRAMDFIIIDENGTKKIYERAEVPQGEASSKLWRLNLDGNSFNKNKLILNAGGTVVGDIPRGVPNFSFPVITLNGFFQLASVALAMAFIGLASSISIAKTISRVTGERVVPNQELVSQGLSNIVSAFSHSSPVAGSFSSSAMNVIAGGKTGMSSIVAGVITLLTLLFFTPFLYHLPQSVLAAIVVCAMINQIKFSVFRRDWRAQWYDGAVGILTFLVTIGAAPNMHYGLITGVGLSLVVLVYRSMDAGVTRLACNSDKRLCAEALLKEKSCRHIAALRFQQSLFYINSSVLEDSILALLAENPELKHVHLVFTGINEVDVSGEESLVMMIRWLRKRGIGISLNGINEKVYSVLERTGVLDEVGHENIFHTTKEAICVAHARISAGENCENCSWQRLCD